MNSKASYLRRLGEFASLPLLIVLALYVLLRIIIWRETTLVETQDSVAMLRWIETFRSLDLAQIIGVDPDASMLYAFLGGLVSQTGITVEHSARLVSFLASVALFYFLFQFGRRIASPVAATLGLALLAFSPVALEHSVSVLTEPTYLAAVYAGLLLLWSQFEKPTAAGAAGLGLIFGLAFLTRLEGVLFVAFVPLMAFLYLFWKKPAGYGIAQLAAWCGIFFASFLVLFALQVWRVSAVMGGLAINGRQAWNVLLNSDYGGDSYPETFYSLDFDPGVVNIDYLKENVSALTTVAPDFVATVRNYVDTLLSNGDDLYTTQLTVVLGVFTLVFFGFGLMRLFQTGRRFEIVFILSFLAFAIFAPLLHNVGARHLVALLPISFLVAGIGIVSVSEQLLPRASSDHARPSWTMGLIASIVIAGWGFDVAGALNPRDANREVSVMELEGPIEAVETLRSGNPERTLRAVSRFGYFPWYAEVEALPMPYTDYQGLARYLELNDANLLYLTSHNAAYPYMQEFGGGEIDSRFTLIYRGPDAQNDSVELYRFDSSGTAD